MRPSMSCRERRFLRRSPDSFETAPEELAPHPRCAHTEENLCSLPCKLGEVRVRHL